MSRKLYSSGLSLGRRSLVSAPRKVAATADAMNKRRFIMSDSGSFYPTRRCQSFVNGALLGGLVRLAQAIVNAREMIVHVRLIGVDRDATFQLRGRLRQSALLFQQ